MLGKTLCVKRVNVYRTNSKKKKKTKHTWNNNKIDYLCPVLPMISLKFINSCRPGTWINDTAFEYPEAHFVGVDILPENLFEQSHFNVEFKQTRSLTRLPFESSTFSFVTMVSTLAIVLIKISEHSLVFSRYSSRIC